VVADIDQLAVIIGLWTKRIPREIDLDPPRSVLEMRKGHLAMTSERHQPPGDRHRGARSPFFRQRCMLPLEIGGEVSNGEPGRVRVHPGPFKLLQLPQPLAN
jgi:hypothetical protein